VDGRLLITAPRAALIRRFALLADLQPLRWTPEGIECAPGAAPEQGAAALGALDLPHRPLPGPAPVLEVTAALRGGVYRRSPAHAPAPAGIREVVQVPGEGFGPGDHPTTLMCLDALTLLPDGPALDAGTGSGLLALAWARLGRGVVLAVDADPHAVDQARRSVAASGLAGAVRVERAMLETLPPAAVEDRVVLANAPRPAQEALLRATRGVGLRALLVSGLRPGEVPAVVAAWRARGLRVVARARRGRWERLVLLPSGGR
jgi:ribosomal protein L11 methyltransferase